MKKMFLAICLFNTTGCIKQHSLSNNPTMGELYQYSDLENDTKFIMNELKIIDKWRIKDSILISRTLKFAWRDTILKTLEIKFIKTTTLSNGINYGWYIKNIDNANCHRQYIKTNMDKHSIADIALSNEDIKSLNINNNSNLLKELYLLIYIQYYAFPPMVCSENTPLEYYLNKRNIVELKNIDDLNTLISLIRDTSIIPYVPPQFKDYFNWYFLETHSEEVFDSLNKYTGDNPVLIYLKQHNLNRIYRNLQADTLRYIDSSLILQKRTLDSVVANHRVISNDSPFLSNRYLDNLQKITGKEQLRTGEVVSYYVDENGAKIIHDFNKRLTYLTNNRKYIESHILKELQNNLGKKEIYYFYTIPDLRVYRITITRNKDNQIVARGKLLNEEYAWVDIYQPTEICF